MSRQVKVGESVAVYFDVRQTDFQSPALLEDGGQPQTSINGASFSNNGISVLTSIGYGRYSAILNTTLLSVAVNDVILTRYKGPSTAESEGDTFVVVAADSTISSDILSISYYGSLLSAELFFSQRLNVTSWTNRSVSDKKKSLIMATKIIDRLNFAGDKANDGQVLQFPRKDTYTNPISLEQTITSDTDVPEDIKSSTYLIALALLDGRDPEIEMRSIQMNMQKYSNSQTFYERSFVPEYLLAGVPSAEAWNYLRPYLRDSREIQISRA